ncbi:DExH-box ATP-dependent RNA helicase DExH3-like [Quercus suber]|uniref:DExH-box ATP-dependent RNA helicase DExH3-like n=1 Tax=Quercus suber TaxID=58331 RepID=UPI0032DEA25F
MWGFCFRILSMHINSLVSSNYLIYTRVLLQNSVNARYQTIPYPWLVFGEKVKVNTVFIRDSTGVSDSILMLFGGALSQGVQAGHLKMLDGYVDFFIDPSMAECYLKLKEELEIHIQKKLEDPNLDIHKEGKYLMLAIQELVSGDQCEGRFVFGRENKKPRESNENRFTKDGTNPKSLLQTLLMRAGHTPLNTKRNTLRQMSSGRW